MKSKYIVVFTPYFKKSVIRDLQRVDNASKAEIFLTDEAMLVSSSLSQKDFFEKLKKVKSAFIKHICPAEKVSLLTGMIDSDRQTVLNEVLNKGLKISGGEKFCVQARIAGAGAEYSCKDIEVFVGTYLEKLGGVPTFSADKLTSENGVKIISIYIHGKDLYIGISDSSDNMNFGCDEYRLLSKGGRQISRAENKLKEAVSKYGLNLYLKNDVESIMSGGKKALDIGAAPGGWTKVLLDAGYEVVAVDPGKLKDELLENPKLTHYKCKIEDLSFDSEFDIITNDINVEPKITGEIMNKLSSFLKSGGMAVVTLKLPGNPETGIAEGVEVLSKKYDVLSVDSLFHNRREVTALIRKK